MEALAVGGLVLSGAVYVYLCSRYPGVIVFTLGCFVAGALVGWCALRFLPLETFVLGLKDNQRELTNLSWTRGSNSIKNLWLQHVGQRPGYAEKRQLERDLHNLVCAGKLLLADARKCIASNWVQCRGKYVAPKHSPERATANRHEW